MSTAADLNLWETPIADAVSALQDRNRDLYIAGFSADGHYALIVDVDNQITSVAHVDTVNGLGRWESTIAHYRSNSKYQNERFPLR